MPKAAQIFSRRSAQALAVRAPPWLAILLAAATFAWLVHGLGRGWELTDESFNLLSALHADSIRLFFTPSHWVSAWLWRASGSLTTFRALGLALATASALLLAWGVLRVAALAGIAVPRAPIERLAVMASAASGALLYGSLLSFTPSYNLLGASGASCAVGLGLLSITCKGRHALALSLLAGIALGITVLCKFSTGLGVAGLMVCIQAAFAGRQRIKLFELGAVLVSAMATLTLAVYWQTGLDEAFRQFRAGIEIVWFAQGDKTTTGRLLRSASDVGGMLTGAAIAFWGPLACFVLALRWQPKVLGGVGLTWFAILILADDHVAGGMSRYALQALPLTGALALALLACTEQWLGNYRAWLLTGLLVVLPFAIALGTWNPLQIQILTALASWGALLGLLGFSNHRTSVPAAWVSVVFSAIVLLQVIGSGAQPYRMHPLWEQVEAVSIEALGSVKVDAKTAALVRDIQWAARQCGIAPGTPFLDFYNLPGVALILDAVPVDTPWLLDHSYAALALKRADIASLRRAVVAVKLNAQHARPEPAPQLAGFPQGYRLCGRATAPLDGLPIELWAPD